MVQINKDVYCSSSQGEDREKQKHLDDTPVNEDKNHVN
jgi:hypothetical protein